MPLASRTFRTHAGKVARFATGGLVVLTLKTALMALNEHVLRHPAWLAYLVVHAVIVVASYLWHARVTFGAPIRLAGFWRFFKAVLLVKALDYGIFSGLVYLGAQRQTVSVVAATVLIFAARYAIMDRRVFREKDGAPHA